jgi:GNAT superfamily N-acetyltransferase
MNDMLVRLYELPSAEEARAVLARDGVAVRRALVPEKPIVLDWVRERFAVWTAEVEASFARMPVACFLAVRGGEIAGFACHDALARNFFGPSGVAEHERGRGIGRALLLTALAALRDAGYAYAIIGGVGPASFYEKVCGATLIEGSERGVYTALFREMGERHRQQA